LEELGNLVIVRGVDPELFMWFFVVVVVDDFFAVLSVVVQGRIITF